MVKRKRVSSVVLRSGYEVPFDAVNVQETMDSLKNGIVGETFQRISPTRKPSWQNVMQEVTAEITHLADTVPPFVARQLLIAALLENVTERLHTAARKAGIKPLPPDTIL